MLVACGGGGSGGVPDGPPVAQPDGAVTTPDATTDATIDAPPIPDTRVLETRDAPSVVDAAFPADAVVLDVPSSSGPDGPSSPPDARPSDAPPPDAAVDACHGIPTTGVCSTPTTVASCVVPEGGDPYIQTVPCNAGEACQIVLGEAHCVLTAECRDGDTQCVSGTEIQTCVGAHWQTATCPRQCIASPLGDFCGLNEPTHALGATLRYEVRGPNPTLTDWGPLFPVNAPGFLVLSVRELQDGSLVPIDAALTGAAGDFSVEVADVPTATDFVLAIAAQAGGDGQFAVALLNPELPPSSVPYDTDLTIANPRLWFWTWASAGVAQGQVLTITEAMGSGAARVFDYLRYVFANTAVRWPGRPRLRLIAWLGGGVSWSCGACFSQRLTNQLGTWFGGQIWLNGGPEQEYWADSVTAHELGHWTMASYGHPVGEGGPHTIGQPATPGLAWSEGYATWFSSDARQDSLYFDKQPTPQGSATFWLDIADRGTSGSPWPRPVAAAGLYQNIYENEVSAMMWNLSATQGLTHGPLDQALASPRMTIPPFLRGYVTPYGQNTTFFADFLDALVCAGTPAPSVDVATDPLVHYPYPSTSPLCSLAPRPPVTVRLDVLRGKPALGSRMSLRASVVRNDPWPFPISLSFQAPSNAAASARLSADTADLELDLTTVPTDDLVVVAESRSRAAGFRAEARYRFGRPEPVASAPRRSGPSMHLGALDLGPPIRGDIP
jgi:hypothetical protein